MGCMFSRPTIIAANQPEPISLTIAADLIGACDNLDPDELKRMISDIAKGSTTIAEGICKLLPKVRISTDLTTSSSALFRAACQQGLKICSNLDKEKVCINPKQSASLTECTHKVAEYLREWQNLEHPHIWVCSSAMVDLVRCLETGLRLLRSCGKENWERRALLGEISTEVMCIHKDLDSLLKCIVSILGTPNQTNSFELATSEALLNASEDLKQLKEHLHQTFEEKNGGLMGYLQSKYLKRFKDLERFKTKNGRLLGYLKSKYGIGGNQPTLINSHHMIFNGHLGDGGGYGYGTVQEVEWMGEALALKSFMIDGYDEQQVISQVSHPNIVKVIGYPDMAILMELLPADLRRRRPSLVEALDIMHQVARAMSYLHNIGILHRDLKPSNILLNTSLDSSWSPQFVVAKLTDFGASKDYFDTKMAMAISGSRGTIKYMAPEIHDTTGNEMGYYSRKIDVFSFGVTFLDILRHFGPLDTCALYLEPLLQSCLNEDANLRPSFPEICNTLSFLRHQLILHDATEAEVHERDLKRRLDLLEGHAQMPIEIPLQRMIQMLRHDILT